MAEQDELVVKLLMLRVQRLAQEALEQEVTDHMGRGHYKRREDDEEHCGYRNCYRPAAL